MPSLARRLPPQSDVGQMHLHRTFCLYSSEATPRSWRKLALYRAPARARGNSGSGITASSRDGTRPVSRPVSHSPPVQAAARRVTLGGALLGARLPSLGDLRRTSSGRGVKRLTHRWVTCGVTPTSWARTNRQSATLPVAYSPSAVCPPRRGNNGSRDHCELAVRRMPDSPLRQHPARPGRSQTRYTRGCWLGELTVSG